MFVLDAYTQKCYDINIQPKRKKKLTKNLCVFLLRFSLIFPIYLLELMCHHEIIDLAGKFCVLLGFVYNRYYMTFYFIYIHSITYLYGYMPLYPPSSSYIHVYYNASISAILYNAMEWK